MPESSQPNSPKPSLQSSAATPSSDLALRQMRQVLDATADGIVIIDREWNFTFANKRALHLVGTEDIIGHNIFQLLPGNNNEPFNTAYRTAMDRHVPAEFEAFYPSPINTWCKVCARPCDDGIIVFFSDITDRKLTELRENAIALRFAQVLEAADDSIVCIDRKWNCSFANRAARTILKTDNLIGENLWTRFPSNQDEPFASNYRTTMEQRIPTDFEAYYPEPLNIWFRVLARPYEDGMIIFSRDVTNRKRAEIARDVSVRELNQVLEVTTDAIVSYDRKWNFTYVNPRAKELLAPSGDLLGKNLWESFPDAIFPDSPFVKHYHRAMDERLPCEFEAYYPAPLNLWLRLQARPSDEGIVVFFRDVTTERAVKNHLLRQQEVLTFVQQTARVATWEVNFESRSMTFGDGSQPVFGRPLDSIKSIETFFSIIHPDDLSLVQKATAKAFETRTVTACDYRVLAEDGNTIWLEGRGIATYDDTDKLVTLRGMTTDITARKLNEEQLSASESRYRVLADLNPQAIWMGAADGSITYANQSFLDYIGMTLDDLAGWLSAFDINDRDRVLSTWLHSVETGEDYEIEARLIRASDGVSRWWSLRGRPVRSESSAILNWLGVAVDIHDSRTAAVSLRAEKLEIERQRAELETIYDTAPIGLALFDPVDFRYLRLNNRQAAFFGLKPVDILGKTVVEMAAIPGLRELFQQVAAGTPVVNQLLEGRLATDPPEEHRYWNVSYSPVLNPDGTVRAITAVSLEITNQKKAEAALIQSEKLAAVGRLASSISHEINNPLEAVTNLLYLIAMNDDMPTELKDYVQTAQSELSRVCQIATQTLRFHRQAVNATHVSAEALVSAVLNLYQGRLANSNIAVEATYATSIKILCFENDIRQVLNNLIANAIDAMRNGGRLVIRAHEATVHATTDPRTSTRGVRITIADTGHGMSAATRDRVFEPFYTTKDLNGTGLGLWISAGIVQRHNGHITLRSSQHPIHHGTVFSLFLPLQVHPTP